MKKLQRTDLHTLESYAVQRPDVRAALLLHKRRRMVQVGPNMTLLFEDRRTVQYQVQEMLRIERIFEPDAIEAELDAYNPLIPDGGNLKATMLIEFTDPQLRAVQLRELRGIERRVHFLVDGQRLDAVADEDLERETTEKTSAVHFLRFEVPAALRAGFAHAAVTLGVDHPQYGHAVPLREETRAALAVDFEPG